MTSSGEQGRYFQLLLYCGGETKGTASPSYRRFYEVGDRGSGRDFSFAFHLDIGTIQVKVQIRDVLEGSPQLRHPLFLVVLDPDPAKHVGCRGRNSLLVLGSLKRFDIGLNATVRRQLP